MEVSQDIKVVIKASVVVIAVMLLIAVGIGILDAVINPDSEKVYGFISFVTNLHDDIDENEIRDDIIDLIDVMR